jgi:hypothetical protein
MRAPEAGTRLERIVAEVRAQRPPEPSQPGLLPPRLRAELRSALAAPRSAVQSVPGRRTRWLPRVALAAVLAGSAAFVLRSVSPQVSLPAQALLDGQALEVGAAVLAAERPRLVQHAQRASWVLAPGSAARLLSAGGVLRVALDRGSLEAEVQPSSQPASFVVEAGGSEVVVHGTHFRVSLLGASTRVAVTRGEVEVRPIGQGRGTLLGAGMQADFAAGSPTPAAVPAAPAVEKAAPSPEPGPSAATPHARLPHAPAAANTSNAPAAQPRAQHTAAPVPPPAAAPSAAAAPTSGAPPSGAAAEQALRAVGEHVQRCFRSNLPGSSELGIEASTQLALWVEPDGDVLRADFEPPLAPAVEACVTVQLAQLKLAQSTDGYRVEREIRLRR